MNEAKQCDGHPAGPFDVMGQTVFCDGSCRQGFDCRKCGAFIDKGLPGADVDCDNCGQTHNCFGQKISFPNGRGEDYAGERYDDDY